MDGTQEELDVLINESQSVLEKQLDRTAAVEKKAGKVLRVNVLTFGVLLTAISIGVQYLIATGSVKSIESAIPLGTALYFGFGLFILGVSAITAAFIYATSWIRIGAGGDDIQRLFNENTESEKSLKRELVAAYSLWLRMNERPLARGRVWITFTMFSVVSSMILFGLGFLYTFISHDSKNSVFFIVTIGMVTLMAILFNIPRMIFVYRSAGRRAQEAASEYYKFVEEGNIEHILEGTTLQGKEPESKTHEGVKSFFDKAERLDHWVREYPERIIPGFNGIQEDLAVQREPTPGELMCEKENGELAMIDTKLAVDSHTLDFTPSAEESVKTYIVAHEFTDDARKKIRELGHKAVQIDEKQVKKDLEK